MNKSAIYEELQKACGQDVVTNVSELSQENLKCILENVLGREDLQKEGVSDEVWEALTDSTKDWVEKAASALNSKKEIPQFPDIVKSSSVSRRVRLAPTDTSKKEEEKEEIVRVDDVIEGSSYTFFLESKQIAGLVVEISRRSIILELESGEESVLHKRDILKVAHSLSDREEKSEVLSEDAGSISDVQKTLLVREAVKGARYVILATDGARQVEAVCNRVTVSKGVFDEEDGTRHRLELDTEIQSIPGEEEIEDVEVSDTPSEVKTKASVVKTKASVEKGSDKKPLSTRTIIRKLVCSNPDITLDAARDFLKSNGVTFSEGTLVCLWKDTKAVLDILEELKK